MPPEAADAVLEAAKDRWIDRHEALEIAAAVSGADTAAAKDRPDINEILDGPPPALPQQEAAPPLPRDAALFATLAEAVRAILSLKTVSAEKLAQSGVSVDDAELAAALLGQIAEALRRKKAA